MKNKYKYQLHTHTLPCSKCAAMSPYELVNALYEGGYDGCVLTNHFYNGNAGIDRTLLWNDFVKQYEEDYIECKNAAYKYDLDIIFGIEEHLFDGLEILCYGITPEILYKNPHLKDDHTLKTWSDILHQYGALCIQAHPYRDRDYINNPRLLSVKYIDGIEVFNQCNKPEENETATTIAQNYPDWILASGADAHVTSLVCCSGIETDVRITDEKKLVNVLKSKDYKLIL